MNKKKIEFLFCFFFCSNKLTTNFIIVVENFKEKKKVFKIKIVNTYYLFFIERKKVPTSNWPFLAIILSIKGNWQKSVQILCS